MMIRDVKNFCVNEQLSSLHINFIEEDQIQFYLENNFIIRYGEQFHFINKQYSSFEDFLNHLSYKKKKQLLKKEVQLKKPKLILKS